MKIPKTQGKGSGWIIDSVIDHNINILKRNLLAGSSYIKLPKILNHPKKVWLILKDLMIINALNDVWGDVYILAIIIQQKLKWLT